MEKYAEIFASNYEPSDEDIIKLRDATQKKAQTLVEVAAVNIPIIDIGGLSFYRNIWAEETAAATIAVFVASMACYDQVMSEDHTVNRMVDSIVLFQELVNSATPDTHIYLVFSKKDIYEEKIKTRNIVDYFPGYKGTPGDAPQGIKYFEAKFLDKNMIDQEKMANVTSYITTLSNLEECRPLLNIISKKVIDQHGKYIERNKAIDQKVASLSSLRSI